MTTDQLIYSTAIGDGIPTALANLIVAQSKLETGNYSSNIFLQDNNAFGYSYVAGAYWQLPTPGITADNGAPAARYASVQDSTHEITDWIKRRQSDGIFPSDLTTIITPAQYASLLNDGGYYGASVSDYTSGLATWLVTETPPAAAVAIGAGSIILFIVLFLLFTRKKSY